MKQVGDEQWISHLLVLMETILPHLTLDSSQCSF